MELDYIHSIDNEFNEGLVIVLILFFFFQIANQTATALDQPAMSDGVVLYFHGKSNEHFSLVSDLNLQINGRFIGHRPAGRTRDYTWIQALGILLNSQSFRVEATKVAKWDTQIDHLKFTYNGEDKVIPSLHLVFTGAKTSKSREYRARTALSYH